jgi:hypothetical protein
MSEPTAANSPESKPLYCGNCGTLIPPDKHFCPNCLAPASLGLPEPPVLPAKQPLVAPEVPPLPAVSPSGGPVPAESPVLPTSPLPPGSAAPPAGPAPVVPPGPNLVPPVIPVGPGGAAPPTFVTEASVVPLPTLPPHQPVRWPWILLSIGTSLAALVLLALSCILLLVAGQTTAAESPTPGQYRLVSLLCCLLPGLILVGGTILGGVRAARAR